MIDRDLLKRTLTLADQLDQLSQHINVLKSYCEEIADCLREEIDSVPALDFLSQRVSDLAAKHGVEAVNEIISAFYPDDVIYEGLKDIPIEHRAPLLQALYKFQRDMEECNSKGFLKSATSVLMRCRNMFCDACCAEAVRAGEVKPRGSSAGFKYEDDGGVCWRCGIPADVFFHPGMEEFTEKYPVPDPVWDEKEERWTRNSPTA